MGLGYRWRGSLFCPGGCFLPRRSLEGVIAPGDWEEAIRDGSFGASGGNPGRAECRREICGGRKEGKPVFEKLGLAKKVSRLKGKTIF
jgi:hypothetical protein